MNSDIVEINIATLETLSQQEFSIMETKNAKKWPPKRTAEIQLCYRKVIRSFEIVSFEQPFQPNLSEQGSYM